MIGPVLLVEDDPLISQDVAEVLAEEGYRVVVATDGGEALSIMRRGDLPAVVLLDLMTPVLNGWDFRREQLQDSRLASVPVVLLSGAEDLARTAAALQVAGYLRKPYGVSDLLGVIAEHCGPAPGGESGAL